MLRGSLQSRRGGEGGAVSVQSGWFRNEASQSLSCATLYKLLLNEKELRVCAVEI